MIQDEALLGELSDDLQGGAQMLREEEQIVGEAEVLQVAQAAEEMGAEHEGIVRLVLHDVSHPDEGAVPGEFGQILFDLIGLEIHPAHHPEDAGILRGQLEEPAGFLDRLAGLDGDRTRERSMGPFLIEIRGQEIPAEALHGVAYPGVFPGAVAPEVLMGIDLHGGRHMNAAGPVTAFLSWSAL